MSEIRDIAERVLFAKTLEEKLKLGAADATDRQPGRAIVLPDSPGRPPELKMSEGGVAIEFPGLNQLDDDHHRGIMLHFLCNHELLAAELMALVLLRFPDAPAGYRAEVYQTMREEQMHTLMYLRRMRACGIEFGELPVNSHFWKIISPMETPMDFITRLNLTFEQANLDFSKYYATQFRQVGDTATAAVLEKIHSDEIGHVSHGLRWFRRWKDSRLTDWEAWNEQLNFPLTPARAKGIAPFNAASRRLVGFDEDYIRRLEVTHVSRGRTPTLHWFNPNAESHAAAATVNRPWQANKTELALENDLEFLMAALCRKDDAILLRNPPSIEHLLTLRRAGFTLPEIIPYEDTPTRKLSGLRPWAWSPDAAEELKRYADKVSERSENPWQNAWPPHWLSKEIGIQFEKQHFATAETGEVFHDVSAAEDYIKTWLGRDRQVLLKAAFSHAGRGHLRVNRDSDPARTRSWIQNTLTSHGSLIAEPWLDRVFDFSALYEIKTDGSAKLLGLTRMENDAAGRFHAIYLANKWGNLLPPELAPFLFKDAQAIELYRDSIPPLLTNHLPGFHGALCIDAMVHRSPDGEFVLRPVVELNARTTMGRLGLEWMLHLQQQQGCLRILRKGRDPIPPDALPLNDPEKAQSFIAIWQNRMELQGMALT